MENFVKTKQCAIIRLLSQMLCPMILGTTRNNKCKDSKASSYFALNSLKNFVKTLQYLLNWGPKMLTQFKQLLSTTRINKCKNRKSSFLCFLDRNWASTASFSQKFSMILNCWINSNSCWAQQETTNAERVRLLLFFGLFVLPTTAIEETLLRFHEIFVFCIELLPNLLLLPSRKEVKIEKCPYFINF